MTDFRLYRKRFIPDETILLKDDVIRLRSDKLLITSWKTLKPKPDFSYGCSCYFLEKGFKISKFYRQDGSLRCYYCDIVSFYQDPATNSLVVSDLLADVVLYPDGTCQILDLDELASAYEQGLITSSQLTDALYRLNDLLQLIRNNEFHTLLTELEKLGL